MRRNTWGSQLVGAQLLIYWALFAVIMVATAAQAAPPRWTIAEVGSFGTLGSQPTALNNRGLGEGRGEGQGFSAR